MQSCEIFVAVQAAPLLPAAELTALHAADDERGCGAAACFTGRVRGGDVVAMTLEHYPDMTERELQKIAAAAAGRWHLRAARIVHRVGRLAPGDDIVFAGALAAHRAAAFSACAFMVDYLKTQAPFWKKEETAAGARWVAARADDDAARRKWESGGGAA